MSGSRALASARRRRAGGAENSSSSSRTPPPPPKPASLPAPMSSSTMGGSNFEANEPPQPPKKMTPTAMLLNHNKVIENLQDVVTNLDSAFASQQQEIDQKLSSLSLDDSNIEFFKQKVKDLDTQLREIKKHILKVQTFAMETNLQCMEMKKKMNESGDSQEVQLERAEEISTILSDSNEGEVTAWRDKIDKRQKDKKIDLDTTCVVSCISTFLITMKCVIQDTTKAQQWIELFKIIKNLNSYCTISVQEEELSIQIMDDSQVCLLNVNIKAHWFDEYESTIETFSFMSTFFVKILHLYSPNTIMTLETIHEKWRISFQYPDQTEKIFELNLMDIEKDLLESQVIEGSMEFQMNTKVFEKYISEMLLFGDNMELVCFEDNLYMKAHGEECKYTLKIPHDVLDEFIVEEELQLKSRVSLKYLSYLLKSHGVFKTVQIKIREDAPIYIVIQEEGLSIHYYIAPKINDDDDDMQDKDFAEYEGNEYEAMENSIVG